MQTRDINDGPAEEDWRRVGEAPQVWERHGRRYTVIGILKASLTDQMDLVFECVDNVQVVG
jgi:hypothetical protein